MSVEAMQSAIRVIGSQTALARILECTPQNVQRMCATGRIPAKHILKIEAASGVSRSVLSPVLYPSESLILVQTLSGKSEAHQACVTAVQVSSGPHLGS